MDKVPKDVWTEILKRLDFDGVCRLAVMKRKVLHTCQTDAFKRHYVAWKGKRWIRSLIVHYLESGHVERSLFFLPMVFIWDHMFFFARVFDTDWENYVVRMMRVCPIKPRDFHYIFQCYWGYTKLEDFAFLFRFGVNTFQDLDQLLRKGVSCENFEWLTINTNVDPNSYWNDIRGDLSVRKLNAFIDKFPNFTFNHTSALWVVKRASFSFFQVFMKRVTLHCSVDELLPTAFNRNAVFWKLLIEDYGAYVDARMILSKHPSFSPNNLLYLFQHERVKNTLLDEVRRYRSFEFTHPCILAYDQLLKRNLITVESIPKPITTWFSIKYIYFVKKYCSQAMIDFCLSFKD